jgi:hypothetical protein
MPVTPRGSRTAIACCSSGRIPGIRGTYLNDRYLLDHLLGEQEKVTAYLLEAIARPVPADEPKKRAGKKRKAA